MRTWLEIKITDKDCDFYNPGEKIEKKSRQNCTWYSTGDIKTRCPYSTFCPYASTKLEKSKQ